MADPLNRFVFHQTINAKKEKFSQLPVDPETTIIYRNEQVVQGYDVMVEMWLWDGIIAQSTIFVADEVAAPSDAALIKMVQTEFKTEKVTISRTEGL